MSLFDRVWILLAVVIGSSVTTAAILLVAGVATGNKDQSRVAVQAVPKTNHTPAGPSRETATLATGPSKARHNAGLLFDAPSLSPTALDDESGGKETERLVSAPARPASSAATTAAVASKTTGDLDDGQEMVRYTEFQSNMIKNHAAITGANLNEQTGKLVVDIRAEGGLFEPQIDNEMQLNARRILRGAVLRKIIPKPIKSVLIRYKVGGKSGALTIAWRAQDIMEIDWVNATFPQMMDTGRLAGLSRPARDMVRNYCDGEGAPKARFCASAYRHKLLK